MSTTTTSNAFVLFGSGPGIGLHVAARFAENRFQHVILLSRDRSRLEKDADEVRAARPGVRVTVIVCDLSKQQSVQEALSTIDQVLQDDGTTLEVVCFNAARVRPTDLLATAPEEYENDFRITNTGLLAVSQWAIPHFQRALQSRSTTSFKPTLLVTAGFLHRQPVPELFSLSAVKAAQHNLVTSLQEVYGPQGIHIALALVGGIVSPEAPNLNPENIANIMWAMYAQDKAQWSKEYEIFE